MKIKTICKLTLIIMCVFLISAVVAKVCRENISDKMSEITRDATTRVTIEKDTVVETSRIEETSEMEELSESEECSTVKSENILSKVNSDDVTTTTEIAIEDTTHGSINLVGVYYDVPISKADQDFIRKVCKYYNFDNKLVYQIMKVESDYNPYCISETDDHGIMQLNARWYKEYLNYNDDYDKYLTNFNIYDIRQNVIVAIRELCSWRNVCAKRGYYAIADMLEAYNRGYGYFNNPSKKNYSTKVLSVDIKVK